MKRDARKIVLTGGPGAGKTAVLELARGHFGSRAEILHEAASIIFSGGFPRHDDACSRRAAQRAIYRIQIELENIADENAEAEIVLCDRGTLDGAAYWVGPMDEYWSQLETSRAIQLARYDSVIHLRTPSRDGGYHLDEVRTESAQAAELIDEKLLDVWSGHPRRFVVDSTHDFIEKARRTLSIIDDESRAIRP